MSHSQNKTVKTNQDVSFFIENIEDDVRKADSRTICKIMSDITGWEPKMWGSSMVGFGEYHYIYESGREGDFFRVGFSPRKQNLTIYLMPGYQDFDEELERLGPHKLGKSCLYIKRLEQVDLYVIREMIEKSLRIMEVKYPLEVVET